MVRKSARQHTDAFRQASFASVDYSDVARRFPFAPERDFQVTLLQKPRKLLTPLDQKNALVAAQIVECECFQFAHRIDAIQIDVIESGFGPRYSWTRVNVGLVTSSSDAASNAAAIPFTSVVFPAPRSPRSSTNFGGASNSSQGTPERNRILDRTSCSVSHFFSRTGSRFTGTV